MGIDPSRCRASQPRGRGPLARGALACLLLGGCALEAHAGATLVRSLDGEGPGLGSPYALAYLPAEGQLLVLAGHADDRDERRVQALRLDGSADALALAPEAFGEEPSGLAFHPGRGTLFATDDDELELYEVDLRGRRRATIDLADLGASDPEGIACDPGRDRLYVADGRARQILELTPDGHLVSRFSFERLGFDDAEGIAYDPRSDHLFVASGKGAGLFELTRSGELVAAYDLAVLGAVRPRGLTLAPSSDPADPAGTLHLYVADGGAKGASHGRVLELALVHRPAAATGVADLVGDVDGFGFRGNEPGFALGDADRDGLLEPGEQLPASALGRSGAGPRDPDDDPATDAMLLLAEGRPVRLVHQLPAAGGAPLWARLTLVVGDARALSGSRNLVRADGALLGELVGSAQRRVAAGAIAATVLELPPRALRELEDRKLQVEIARPPGAGGDDIMIDYSRLEVAFAR